ncbi:tetratricopeptide repeat protein [Gelidibacter mesophilus]|uniref:tetratricopeptide repeat protein n=1 Tax=Gelidibacter mesophilus TaxID=169050 RepID=UPI00040BA2AC|nr:tetratricopeptide repeat protein [Gelidibacter mesophilus]
MEFSQHDDDDNYSLTKFESMLKTNNVLFFDSNEFENIIQFYFENGRIALAKKAVKLGLEQHPSSIILRLFQVEIYILEDKLPHAEKLLDALYILEPSNEEVYIQKASILSKRNEHQKAIDTLKIALKLSNTEEDEADLHALIGMEYLFMDQFDNAKTYFIKCLELDMEDYSALYNIIYCFEFLDLHDEAIDFLNRYLDKNPYCEVAWHQLGKQYFSLKDYKKSLAAFEFAIISDDTFVGAYLEKGKVLEKMKKFDEAIENYNMTLALDEPTSFALLRIGNCYEKLSADDLAVQYYFKTVHEDPLLDKGWIAITRFYNKKKDYHKALYYINKAINIDADNVKYWKLYAQINHRLNFIEEAERGYKKTLDLGNYELDTWLARADVLIKLGEHEASALSLIQASEFYPETAEIEYRLAGIYFTLFENEKGQYHLKNGWLLNSELCFILQELFPLIADHQMVVNIISNSKKTSK